ncbi:CDP-glucose 4,6-dehydratase [Rubripirellula sp.]|nr:CDP-glucose 4,6-dehydratase [Rubripirellula sp.]MDB4634052.1 CDP-glucose 4,6-dehydratase [Rubripirellula sp.]
MDFAETRVFEGKRVFLTGHTGFKGSWLALWLHSLGAEVTGYALDPPTNPNHFTVAGIESVLEKHHVADIRDEQELNTAMRDARPDLVMHLAAQTVVRTGYEIPRETFDINVMGTIGVLDAIRALDKPCAALMVTSDKCYENVEQVWGYREEDALGEHDPYGGSKGAAEIAIRSYRHSFFPVDRINEHGIRLASARAGNVIGGGDWTKHALIVDAFHALAADRPIEIRSPKALRPWQHVLQCLSGYMTLASKLLTTNDREFCSGWNIGPLPGNELPVQEVVEHFIKCWGSGEYLDSSDPNQLPEANILRLCIDKAIWKLKWRPCWSTYDSLAKTVDWYQAYLQAPNEMRAVSLSQIADYQHALNGDQHELSTANSPV